MTLHAHGATRIVTESFCVHEQMFKCMCYVCVYACVRLSVLVDSVRGQGEVCGGKATLVASRSFISREAECPFGRSRLSLSHPDQVSAPGARGAGGRARVSGRGRSCLHGMSLQLQTQCQTIFLPPVCVSTMRPSVSP